MDGESRLRISSSQRGLFVAGNGHSRHAEGIHVFLYTRDKSCDSILQAIRKVQLRDIRTMRRTKSKVSLHYGRTMVKKDRTWPFDFDEFLLKAPVPAFDHCSTSHAKISIEPCGWHELLRSCASQRETGEPTSVP